ncbi:MAG: hypothetical protein OZSIB_0268 [Candidatus Ozemobacter sibiricus]|uniref:Type II secretion system protein n=1 Tax=Candidatus Ozemobacter sibiricus TaxID=2268124 RepID=A0A367ZM07_9BACT|nr:MAG: hypothetical protein OZSIB_0268 [Candidatus Ozemobacter sibiricus]
MPRGRLGFSMIEILVALVFVSFSFLPIYNLFRFGHRGAVSNEKEIEATNYASDLINFMRDRKASELDTLFKSVKDPPEMKNDDEIADMIRRLNLAPLPKVGEGYVRSMKIKRFEGKNNKGPAGIVGWLSDFINRRRAVNNYLVRVRVAYPLVGAGKSSNQEDDVVLYTIVMD